MIGETTQGHYRADVRNKETDNWYRTSDNECPKLLSEQNLTKMGYIFLYKKSSNGKGGTEDVSNEVNSKSESELLSNIICFLDEMNIDLVFYGKFHKKQIIPLNLFLLPDFDELKDTQLMWIKKVLIEPLNVKKIIDRLGKR